MAARSVTRLPGGGPGGAPTSVALGTGAAWCDLRRWGPADRHRATKHPDIPGQSSCAAGALLALGGAAAPLTGCDLVDRDRSTSATTATRYGRWSTRRSRWRAAYQAQRAPRIPNCADRLDPIAETHHRARHRVGPGDRRRPPSAAPPRPATRRHRPGRRARRPAQPLEKTAQQSRHRRLRRSARGTRRPTRIDHRRPRHPPGGTEVRQPIRQGIERSPPPSPPSTRPSSGTGGSVSTSAARPRTRPARPRPRTAAAATRWWCSSPRPAASSPADRAAYALPFPVTDRAERAAASRSSVEERTAAALAGRLSAPPRATTATGAAMR